MGVVSLAEMVTRRYAKGKPWAVPSAVRGDSRKLEKRGAWQEKRQRCSRWGLFRI